MGCLRVAWTVRAGVHPCSWLDGQVGHCVALAHCLKAETGELNPGEETALLPHTSSPCCSPLSPVLAWGFPQPWGSGFLRL